MKKIDSIIVNFILVLYLEILFSFVIFKNITISFLLLSFLFTSILVAIINILTRLSKNEKLNKIINISFFAFLTVVFVAQIIHYKFYDAIFSFYSMLKGTGQVMGFFDTILTVILQNWYFIILTLVPIVLIIQYNKKINYERLKLKYVISLVIISISFYCISLIPINMNKDEVYSKYNLYYKTHSPIQMVKEFGLLNTMRLDIQRLITKFKDIPISNISFQELEKNTKYNSIEIDFDSLIENENNETVKEMHKYFSNVVPTNQNIYTGYFEGKNLILIVGEAVNIAAIDKEHTPTLYKITHDGFSFSNFYTPIYYASTSDGEYTALNSLLPKEGVWSFVETKNNYMPYSFGNAFKTKNYKTYAYHDGTYDYYNRDLTHPNIGFDIYRACGKGLNINCGIWPQSDYEMVQDTIKDYINEKQFLTYYMTISSHLNYTWTGNTMALKNKDAVSDMDLSETAKGYVATHIELDKALEFLLKELEANNQLENTVIAMVADHYPYGLRKGELKEFRDDIIDEKFDIHKNFFSIWNSEIKEPIVTEKYASNVDVLPTLLNMFNIEYDSRLLIGKDIFSNSEGIVVFNDRSWITKYGKYNALTNEFTPYQENIKEDYVDNTVSLVYNKFLYSRLILEEDYYRKVLK